jgi:ABC-2 type transport system ATP-binding protein
MESAIEIRDLHKRYGQTVAVDGLTFNVASGEIFGLLGPNGAGKTTTVECLLGLRTPDAGGICLLGMMHADQSRSIRARIGVQLQSTGLLPQLTVREQVQLFADLFPRSLAVDEVVARVGLTEMAKTATRALSGGLKQRLAVALALVNDPDLLFLDEPTTGLDPQARRATWDLVRELRQTGKTMLLTTHYMEEAEQLCDRVAIMDHGRIIELGTPQALIHKYFRETAIEFTAQSDVPRESLEALPAASQTRFENGQVTLYSADVPRTMAALFELASTSALAFRDVSVRQATLEDVFLKLTGRRIRA